jgi:hypothetical protein
LARRVMVEEGTDNIQPDPDFADGMTGKETWDWGGGGVVTASDGICTMDNADSASTLALIVPVSITADTGAHTVSIKCRSANGEDAAVEVYMGVSYKSLGVAPASGEWVVLSATYNDGEYTTNPRQHTRIWPGKKIQLDWIQVEKKPYATSFTPGTRSPETLTIPTEGVLNPQEGTVECWVMLNEVESERTIFDAGGLEVYITNSKLGLQYDEETLEGVTSLEAGTWYAIAWKWSNSGVILLLNGETEASSDDAPILLFSENVYIGSKSDGTLQLNGLIDGLRISSRARTTEEILAAYQSGQPLQKDEYTTYLMPFNGSIYPVEWVPLGTFWSLDWDSPDDTLGGHRNRTGQDGVAAEGDIPDKPGAAEQKPV